MSETFLDGSQKKVSVSPSSPLPVSIISGDAGDASAANQLILNTEIGATNEVAASSDTATSGLNGRLQRIAQRLSAVITALGSPLQAGGNIGNIVGTISLPTGAATEATLSSASAKLPASLGAKTGAGSLSVVPASDGFATIVAGDVAGGATDSGNPVKAGGLYSSTLPTLSNGQRGNWQINAKGMGYVQLGDGNGNLSSLGSNGSDGVTTAAVGMFVNSVNYVCNGSTLDRQRGDTNGISVQSGLSSTFWNYAAASGGIANTTTAVTIKAAGGASVRNYLKTLTIAHDTLGAATELAIRDGAAGPVLWRGKLQTAAIDSGAAASLEFDPPLKGSANTLMEVVTLTAVTGGVFINATGFTGS